LSSAQAGALPGSEPFTVTADILNDVTATFTGEFEVDLYYMDGDHAAIVQNLTGAELEGGYYYNDVEFSSDGVSVSPGTYLMALSHKPEGGTGPFPAPPIFPTR
jgi:hypothetical protein